VTGPLSVSIAASVTNVALGFPAVFTALIEGRTTASVWVYGDGLATLNRPYVTHVWNSPGDYPLTLWAFNDSYPEGLSATVTIHVLAQPVQYVALSSTNPVAPYTSWATAAKNIQDAVDSGFANGTILVTNGVYATGGRAVYGTMTNRVAVDKPLNVRSVNGPEFTVIRGYQVPGTTNGDGAIRCVYLADGANLSGFTLANGSTRAEDDWPSYQAGSGGGVWCESSASVVSNCVLTGNSAIYGGGAYWGTLNNCTLTGNVASDGGGASGGTLNNSTLIGNVAWYGGGVSGTTLNNCTLAGNLASEGGGGAFNSTLNNCIVYFNANGEDYDTSSILNYCCTTPLPTNGVGNITKAPLFVDYAGGNLRLQSNSPCINAGNNAYVTVTTDLDGNPRIVSGMVDIGAYEYQGTGSVISYAWLQHYGLPTDGSADFADSDHDGLSNWQEWRCGTCPTDALSALRLLAVSPTGTNLSVTWHSVAGVSYFLERSTNLGPSTLFTPLATDIPGQPGMTSYTDTTATNAGPYFYRVGVGN
jgi:hypothetical protein